MFSSIKAIALILLTLTLLCSCSKDCKNGPLAGMFYQPWNIDIDLEEDDWQTYMESLQRSGVNSIYVQWLIRGNSDFLNQRTNTGDFYPTFLLDAAHDHNISVYFGLYSDPNYFEKIQGGETGVSQYLQETLIVNANVAKRFMEIIGSHPAMRGWYLNQEIDDINWQGEKRLTIIRHINQLTRELTQISELHTFYISAFYSGNQNIDQYGRFLNKLVFDTPVTLLFQDGLGVTSAPLKAKSKQFYSITQQFITMNKTGWVVELFNDQGDASFLGSPASYSDIQKRIRIIPKKIPRKNVVGFSLRYWIGDDFKIAKSYHKQFCRSKP